MVGKILTLSAALILIAACHGTGDRTETGTNNSSKKVEYKAEKSKVKRISKGGTLLNPEVQLDRTHLLVGKEEEIFLMVKFVAPKREKHLSKRPDLSLSMVLDHSGSMEYEQKLDHVKEAAKYGVDQLKPSDNVAVVKYCSTVKTIWPLSKAVKPNTVKEVINSVAIDGGTNLCGGMDEGIRQLSQKHKGKITRVILLSDGLANEGITDTNEIVNHARKAYRRGISVSTMGVGADYDENLMQKIAEAGGGRYFFIKNATDIKEIFAKEMGGIFETVAQNFSIFVAKNRDLISCDLVGGTGNVKQFASLSRGEQQVIIFKLKVKASKIGKVDLGKVKISYDRPNSPKKDLLEFALIMDAVNDRAKAESSVVKTVRAEALLVETELVHEKSVKLYEEGHKDEALRAITTQNELIKQSNELLHDKQIESKVEAFEMEQVEMAEADKNAYNRSVYLKKSKERSYNAKMGKRGQIMVSGSSEYDAVVSLQKALKDEQKYKGPIDGVYSIDLKRAVAQYQQEHGIVADSIAGPKMLKLLGLY